MQIICTKRDRTHAANVPEICVMNKKNWRWTGKNEKVQHLHDIIEQIIEIMAISEKRYKLWPKAIIRATQVHGTTKHLT